MKSFNLFPTLVKEYSVEGYHRQDELLNAINSHPTTTHGAVKGGNSSFHITKNKNFLKEFNFYDLDTFFTKCIADYSQEIGIQPPTINQCWFNKMSPQNHTLRHHHPGSIISGAYYPNLKENTCNLIFHSPISHYQQMWYENIKTTLYNNPQITIQLKQNHLYLFPSWLDHSTEINKGDKRIVISFNTIPS